MKTLAHDPTREGTKPKVQFARSSARALMREMLRYVSGLVDVISPRKRRAKSLRPKRTLCFKRSWHKFQDNGIHSPQLAPIYLVARYTTVVIPQHGRGCDHVITLLNEQCGEEEQ